MGVDADIAKAKGAGDVEAYEEWTRNVDFEVGHGLSVEGTNSLLCSFIVEVGKFGRKIMGEVAAYHEERGGVLLEFERYSLGESLERRGRCFVFYDDGNDGCVGPCGCQKREQGKHAVLFFERRVVGVKVGEFC